MDEELFREKWTAVSLLRFAFPTVVMMLFMGLYTLVDTIFVARLVHTDALSAVNIVCPVINLTVGIGTMLATGGNAIVARKLGAGQGREANQNFTLLVLAGAAAGVVLALGGLLGRDPIIRALGASRRLFPYCRDYLTVLFLFLPANLLQTLFSNLFVTAGRPGLGFGLALLAGGANILLDYLFMACWGLGVRGAALGTGLGCLIPTAAGLVFFARGTGALRFVWPKLEWRVLRESCLNGASEMVSQLAAAVTTFLFNITMMELLGEDGVAAITILIYAQFLMDAWYIGFSMGMAPVIGFHHGARDGGQQRKVFQISIGFLALSSALVFLLFRCGGEGIVRLFAADGSQVHAIAARGMAIFAYSFLFRGLNIYTSAMFTALSNGRVSAVLSFLRTFGLLAGGILLLSRLWGITGVWLAVPAAEGIMFIVSLACLIHYRARYSY